MLLPIKWEIDNLLIVIEINKNELKKWANSFYDNVGNLVKSQMFLIGMSKQDELGDMISKLLKWLMKKQKEKEEIIKLVDKFQRLNQQIFKLKYIEDMKLEATAEDSNQ